MLGKKSTELLHLEDLSWELNWLSLISDCFCLMLYNFYLTFLFLTIKMINIPAHLISLNVSCLSKMNPNLIYLKWNATHLSGTEKGGKKKNVISQGFRQHRKAQPGKARKPSRLFSVVCFTHASQNWMTKFLKEARTSPLYSATPWEHPPGCPVYSFIHT